VQAEGNRWGKPLLTRGGDGKGAKERRPAESLWPPYMVDHQNIEGIGGSPKASSENWMVPLSLRERDRVRELKLG